MSRNRVHLGILEASAWTLLFSLAVLGAADRSRAQTPLEFTRTFSLHLARILPLSGQGVGVATTTSAVPALDQIQIPGTTYYGSLGIFATFTTAYMSSSVGTISAVPQTGTLSGAPLSGRMPVTGRIVLPPNSVHFTYAGTRGVGIGGPPITNTTVNPFFFTLSLQGARWTSGVATVTTGLGSTLTRAGFAHGPVSNTSTPGQIDGVIQLVTPIRIVIHAPDLPPYYVDFSGFGVMELHFVPEPSSLILLTTAGAALALLGHRRAARRRGRA